MKSRAARSSALPRRVSAGRRGTLSNVEADQFAKQLVKLEAARQEFDALLVKLQQDVTAPGLKLIARDFLGREVVATKKADIVAAIRRRQRQNELNRDRRSAQSKIQP